jgi:hypothetical protein
LSSTSFSCQSKQKARRFLRGAKSKGIAMPEIAKVYRHDVQALDGVQCVVVYIHDGAGRDRGAAIPFGAFRSMAATVRRKQLAQSVKEKGEPDVKGYYYAELHWAQTYDVGTLRTPEGDMIALITDRGTDDETGFRLPIEHARELGQQLLDEAGRASSTRPLKN